jgi:hypothetical protein
VQNIGFQIRKYSLSRPALGTGARQSSTNQILCLYHYDLQEFQVVSTVSIVRTRSGLTATTAELNEYDLLCPRAL